MIKRPLEERLIKTIELGLADSQFELVDVFVTGPAKYPVVGVYVDARDGITSESVVEASKLVELILDDADPIAGSYQLEVSSPGIDRPLRLPAHYRRFGGQMVDIKRTPVGGRKTHFTGRIEKVSDEDVVVETAEGPLTFLYSEITRSRLVGSVDFSRDERKESTDE